LADDAGITIQFERTEATRDISVWADPDRVTQVLVNLLNNAIKFSPSASVITAGVGVLDGETQPEMARFWVRDEGRGIPEDQLDHVFNRFTQVDPSDPKEKLGAGLGLAICRAIVRQHGGQIWVESESARGSTFYFTLPRKQPSAPLSNANALEQLPEP
jgi:signal transduction histidine kinase